MHLALKLPGGFAFAGHRWWFTTGGSRTDNLVRGDHLPSTRKVLIALKYAVVLTLKLSLRSGFSTT